MKKDETLKGFSSKEQFIIEYEGYLNDNKVYIIKEICFYDIQKGHFFNYFLKTNKITNKTYFWLLNNYHKIPYTYGNVSFNFVKEYFFDCDSIFYIKGIDKINVIQKFTKNICINLESLGCENFKNLKIPSYSPYCEFHDIYSYSIDDKYTHYFEHCALKKAAKLGLWYNEHFIDEKKG